jgi:hypothetical protein
MSIVNEASRAELARAIEARDAAAAEVERAKVAAERIGDQLYEARARLEEVRAQAGERESERVAALVAGGDVAVVERDRFAERNAQDAVTACRAARDLCKAAVADAEASLGYKKLRVEAAVRPILVAEAGRIIKDVEDMKVKFDEMRATLAFLSRALPAGKPLSLRIDAALDVAPAQRLELPAKWRQAHEALMRDADWPLPG